MNCWCKTRKGEKCSKRGHMVTVTQEKEANLCSAHKKVFRLKGLESLDFHTQPVSKMKIEEPELPFQHTAHEARAKVADAKKELEEAMGKSRVIDTMENAAPGVHPPSLFVIAGTGSRSLQQANTETKMEAKARVMAEIEASKANHGDNLVIMSGMAEGFDKLIALCAIEQEVKLWCAIPNKGYADYYWGRNSLTGQNQMAAFNAIVANAWRVTYVFEDVHHKHTGLHINGRHSNFVRNDYMVAQGNAFWVWDPTSSGTRDCLDSIKAAGKPYRVLST